MKNLFNLVILSVFFIVISSCDDIGTNVNNSFQKMKITIYVSHSGDTNDFVKNSEYFFDGDVDGYLRRMLRSLTGNFNYKSTLEQYRSNVPLPLSKYGCLIKNIEYFRDTIFSITRYEYDSEQYIKKGYFDSYSSINKSSYVNYYRKGEKLVKIQTYSDDILNRISNLFYNKKGLCTLQVDSTIASASVRKTFRRYNDKKELIYALYGKDSTSGTVTEYFYDSDGNNIKQIYYEKINNDTSNTRVYNWVMYKGYRMEEKKIERFEFDSKDNIIGYINPDFGKTRYKIEYTNY